MGRNNKTAQYKRLTLSVPVSDTAVFDWLEAQYNLSASLRIIIKDYAARYGNVDVSSLPTVINNNHPIPATVQSEPLSETQSQVKTEPQTAENSQTSSTTTNTSSMLDDLMK